MQDEKTSRRAVLKTVGAATILSCLGCFGGGSVQAATGPIGGGNVRDYEVGSLRVVPGGEPVAVGRDAGGLYALNAICTHAQCDMTKDGTVNGDGLYCNCHASRFDVNGAVIAGPAKSALAHYAVEVGPDGSITVQASRTVDASTRTALAT